jgi:hypothetical protein
VIDVLVAGGGRGDAAEVSVLEPVAVSFQCDDLGAVDEAVDHGGGDGVVAENLSPAAEWLVACDAEAGSFVAAAYELEEQVGGLYLEGDVADLVDLCGYPHRSTYADTGTMPRALRTSLVRGPGGRSVIGIVRCHVVLVDVEDGSGAVKEVEDVAAEVPAE